MKKLLLVLAVVAMASFLFVGCLPGGTTPDNGDGDGDGDGVVAPVIEVVGGYVDSDGVTYLKATGNTVKVTFSEAVDSEYSVYIAKKTLDADGDPVYTPTAGILATTTDRLVWTATVDVVDLEADECVPICLVALEKHPCCPGDEAAIKVVTPDTIAPDFVVTLDAADFLDCAGCETPDPCLPCAVYLNWSSITPASGCDPAVDACEDADACSGVGVWEFMVDKDGCYECVVATGTGCPITIADGCACFLGSEDNTPIDYELTFDIKDNAGNAATQQSWTIRVDSDCLVIVNPS